MTFAFALLNCFGLGPWVFLHLVSTLDPIEQGSEKSGVIGHLESVQGPPTTSHYCSTGSLSFGSPHTLCTFKKAVLFIEATVISFIQEG